MLFFIDTELFKTFPGQQSLQTHSIGLIYQIIAPSFDLKWSSVIEVWRSNRGPSLKFFALKRWNQTLLCMIYTLSRNAGWAKFFHAMTQILVDFSSRFYEEIQVESIMPMMMILNNSTFRTMIMMLCTLHIQKNNFLMSLKIHFFSDFWLWPQEL